MAPEHSVTLEQALNTVMHPDRTPPQSRQYMLRVQSSGNRLDYEIVNVNFNDPEDKIADFIKAQEPVIAGYVANPDTIDVPKKNTYGRQRKSSEVTQIRESKLKEYKFELAVLRGDIMAPITIIESTKKYKSGEEETYFSGYSISREDLKF